MHRQATAGSPNSDSLSGRGRENHLLKLRSQPIRFGAINMSTLFGDGDGSMLILTALAEPERPKTPWSAKGWQIRAAVAYSGSLRNRLIAVQIKFRLGKEGLGASIVSAAMESL